MAKKSRKNAVKSATDAILNTEDYQINEEVPDVPADNEETELEKLVFGDLAGFQDGLRIEEESEDEDEEGNELAIAGQGDDELLKDFAALQDDQLFFVDSGPNASVARSESPKPADHEDTIVNDKDLPAWVDSDDERTMVSLASHNRTRKLRDTQAEDRVSGKEYARRLRRQFERIYPIPEWALPPKPSKRRRRDTASSSSSDSDVEPSESALSAPPLAALLQTTEGYTRKSDSKTAKLRPETLDIARLKDANDLNPSQSGIQSLSFHPTHPLLLTSGFDSTMRLYHIDGKKNPPATSLHIRSTPIHTAQIHPSGDRVFAGGRRRYFHIWSLQSGMVEKVTRIYGHQETQKSMERFSLSPSGAYMSLIGSKGTLQILDTTTTQWICSANVEGEIADIAWSFTSDLVVIANTAGEVYDYSLTTKSIISVWRDEGGVSTTRISISPNNRWIVVGSGTGLVNIYDRRLSFGGKVPGALGTPTDPKPIKTIENLVTSINVLEFSPDSQVLCIASRAKKDALKMVHLPSCTVYKNWPTSNTPLGRVTAVAFAPGKEVGMMAVGNEQGRVRLFEIR